MDDNKITATQNEAVYLFKKIDWDHDGRVSYSDFAQYSISNAYKSSVALRESYQIDVGMLLPSEVELALADLFSQELQNYRTLAIRKNDLVSSLDYSSLEAFKQLDLFNLGYLTADSLAIFMRAQGQELLADEIDAFFRAVDLDFDGRISYSELIEAVHLLEPLPYKLPSSLAIREAELQAALERSRSLERIHYPYYPYYFSPYYPLYYPSYYPYLRLTEQRLRESSLDRLRRSRLAQLEADSRVRELEHERRRSQERLRSAERLRQIEQERLLRQSQIEEQNRIRDLDRLRDNELRRSRERIREAEYENRLRNIDHESRLREIERQNRLTFLERESRARQLENERKLVESEVRLRSLERLSSLDRVRYLDRVRAVEGELALSRYYPQYSRYFPQVLNKYPYSIADAINNSQLYRPVYESRLYESPIKYFSVADQKPKREFNASRVDKSGILENSLKRSIIQ